MKKHVRILNVIRLGLFPLGYGLIGALVGGVLNRIMIADLSMPATLVGFFFAVPLLESPVRLWIGYRSDGFPVFGKRREPYIIFGALLAGVGLIASVLVINANPSGLGLLAGGLLTFLIYGFGRNLGHNIFQALMADNFKGDQRARAATIYEVVTLLGAVAGAGGLGAALRTYEPSRLLTVTTAVAAVFFILGLVAAIGQEKKGLATEAASRQARQMPFGQAVREVLLGDRQVKLFFFLIFFTFIGTLGQDVLLEPYGALVLGMTVSETTRLTMFWGLGVIASMLLSGIILIKLFGHMNIMRAGLAVSIVVFAGLIFAGMNDNTGLFNNLVLVMGLGTGLAGAGMLTGALNFTTPVRAGLLMGIWGMANLLGKATGSVVGGALVDIMRLATGSAFTGYALVFALDVVLLVIAFGLTFRINTEQSKVTEEIRLETMQAAVSSAD